MLPVGSELLIPWMAESAAIPPPMIKYLKVFMWLRILDYEKFRTRVNDVDPDKALIEFLRTFEDPAFIPAEWPDRGKRQLPNGKEAIVMPYPDYHPEVERFLEAMHSFTAGIHPYETLPEDPHQAEGAFDVRMVQFQPDYFLSASRNQIRRFFSLMYQGERFSDGHIEAQFLNGCIVAALKRLEAIQEN
jgi:hypothetical protein